MRYVTLMLGLAVALSAAQVPGQANDPARAAVSAASKYVERYHADFSAIVCEEKQTQTMVKPDGLVSKTRVLVSDLMFIKVGSSWVLQSFRDVISVDGKPTRNRDDRLRKLFLDGKKDAVELARAIGRESGRYNLGIDRVGNSPLLPIMLLDPHAVANVAFTLSDRTLTFREVRIPTLLGLTSKGKRVNLPSNGSVTLDPSTGAISSATLTAESPEAPVSTRFSVRYAEEPTLKMLVPVEMQEHYHLPAKPKDDHFESTATYSAFRRFQVTTSEIIK